MELQEITEIVGIAVGKGSMCWSEIPKGIFNSGEASKIVEEAAQKIYDLKEKEKSI